MKHSKMKTEARSTQISKTKHLNLKNEAPKIENEAPKSQKRRLQNSKMKHLNQVEAADASAPPKVHKIHPKVL